MAGIGKQLSGSLARLRQKLREPLLMASCVAIAGIVVADSGVFHPISAIAAILVGAGGYLQSRQRRFLLLAIAGCGNKGPLIPAEDEKQKQNQTAAE